MILLVYSGNEVCTKVEVFVYRISNVEQPIEPTIVNATETIPNNAAKHAAQVLFPHVQEIVIFIAWISR